MTRIGGQALITGIGISDIGRRLGIPGGDLTIAASRAAIDDAGITPADIDAVLTMDEVPVDATVAALGLGELRKVPRDDRAGLFGPVLGAIEAVASGQARHVLVYRTVQMMGGAVGPAAPGSSAAASGRASADAGGRAPKGPSLADRLGPMAQVGELMAHHSYSASNWVALHCARHMHRYGTTREQLGALAVQSRLHAARNPLAAYRDPITLDDYLSARPISTPFGLLDCDVPIDGAIAVVVSAADFEPDCRSTPLRVDAVGASDRGGWFGRADYPRMASWEAAAELWASTDLRPADLDLAQLYDGFTYLTLAWIEALGLCAEGEGGAFLAEPGRIDLDGALPLNTYGGQLSAGRMHGYWVLHEACVQLRGLGDQRQVPGGPEVAVVAAGGGPFAGCLLLTR